VSVFSNTYISGGEGGSLTATPCQPSKTLANSKFPTSYGSRASSAFKPS
jgi:hypothetical protein